MWAGVVRVVRVAGALLVLGAGAAEAGAGRECTPPPVEAVRVLVSADRLPLGVLSSAAGLLANLTAGPEPWDRWARPALATTPDLAAVALLSHPHFYLSYHPGLAGPSNLSAPAFINQLAANRSIPSWTSPFWDCYLAEWLFGYVSPHPSNRGTVGLFYLLSKLEIDQCDDQLYPLLTNGFQCDLATTKCVPVSGYGTRKGGFRCVCRPGFTAPPLTHFSNMSTDSSLIYRCIPACENGTNCLGRPSYLLRIAVIVVQVCCMTFTLGVCLVIFKRRKCKPVAAGMWTILETVLFGILLLYASVVPKALSPSLNTCIVERWIREVGFIVCYGAILLKLYKILMEFRTRKAHRWVVRDKDLLKYLLGMVLITVGYLSAWTATNFNFIQEGFTLVVMGQTILGEPFETCKILWWDWITQFAEMAILLFGLHLGIAARNARLQYVELRYLLGALSIELVISSAYYLALGAGWNTLHPTHTFLATFIRSQLTNTVVLMLVFIPIILFNHKPVRDAKQLSHEPSDAYKPQDGICSDIDVAEVNLSEMNTEEIRTELKRLYTQLEVLKNKTIRQNNPHISKRRGGRKTAHRRFSLQVRSKKGSKEKKKGKSQGAESDPGDPEVSRTPEDSVCSLEGPSAVYNDGPSPAISDLAAASSSAVACSSQSIPKL